MQTLKRIYTKCLSCGESLAHHPRQRNPKKWCSDACRVRAHRQRNPDYVERMRVAAAERQRASYVPVSYDRACAVCGTAFVAHRSDRRYCSAECRRKAYSAARRADGRAADYTARRRALEKGAKVSRGRRLAILERDAWVCQLCSHPARREAVYPDWDFAVIDHIVPLTSGGAHEAENWQAAHAFCNSLKSDLDLAEFQMLYPDLGAVVAERLALTS